MFYIFNNFFIGFLVNSILILVFSRIPIMTKNGWISAGILGTILWGCLSWQGWMSVVLYLIFGSLVTKIGFKYKESKGIAEKRSGKRGPENVWGSSATGLFFAVLIKLDFSNLAILKVAFAASFAAKLADTFGSEIGKRFGTNTYLITTFQKVKKGTEGGISFEGTLASLLGALIMSYSMYFLDIINMKSELQIVLFSGFFATVLESYIGARFQEKYKLTNEIVNTIQTSLSSIVSILIYSAWVYFN